MKDASLIKTVALPAAAASASTAAIDLGVPNADQIGVVKVTITLPALPALVDDKTVTVSLTDCATSGGSYTAIPGVGNLVVTGAGGAGAAAKTWVLYLPPHTKQFLKGKADVLTGGGDNTAKSLTIEVQA